MAVITISRELGSEGDKIADAVCGELGYTRIEKTMLSEIAARAGVDVDAVQAMEHSFVARSRLVSTEMTALYNKAPGAFDKKLALDDKTYAEIVRKTLLEYAAQGNVVIIGRGGQMVLRDWPNALHVQLFAAVDVPRATPHGALQYFGRRGEAAYCRLRRREAPGHPPHAQQRGVERPQALSSCRQHRPRGSRCSGAVDRARSARN